MTQTSLVLVGKSKVLSSKHGSLLKGDWERTNLGFFFPLRRLSHQLKRYCFLMQSLVRMLTCFRLSLNSDSRTGAHGCLIPHSSIVFCATLSRVDQILSTIMFKGNISWVFLFYINKAPQWWPSCGLAEEPRVSLHGVIKGPSVIKFQILPFGCYNIFLLWQTLWCEMFFFLNIIRCSSPFLFFFFLYDLIWFDLRDYMEYTHYK